MEEPFRGDHDDASVAFEAGNVRDPLEWRPVLQQLREEYFKRAPLDAISDGIDDFLRFKGVCTELHRITCGRGALLAGGWQH